MHGPASSSFCRPHSCSFFYCLIKVWLPSIYIPLPPPVVHTENWCDGFQQDVNSFLKSVNEQWIDSNNKPVWILDITMIHDSEAHILLVVWLQVTDWKHWTAFGLSSPSQQKISVKQWTQALSILRCVCVCVHKQGKTLTLCDRLPKVSSWRERSNGGGGGREPPTMLPAITFPVQWPGAWISGAVTCCPLRPANTLSPSRPKVLVLMRHLTRN